MKRWDLLQRINDTEAAIWSAYARHHLVDETILVYDTLSPTHIWSNTLYPTLVQRPVTRKDAEHFARFYQIHGLEGFLRDFTGEYRPAAMARFDYFVSQTEDVPHLSSSREARLMETTGDLGAYAEALALCSGWNASSVDGQIKRWSRLPSQVKFATYIWRGDHRVSAALSVLSLPGHWPRLYHWAVRAEERTPKSRAEVLRDVSAQFRLPLVVAVDMSDSWIANAAGLQFVGGMNVVPLLSIARPSARAIME